MTITTSPAFDAAYLKELQLLIGNGNRITVTAPSGSSATIKDGQVKILENDYPEILPPQLGKTPLQLFVGAVKRIAPSEHLRAHTKEGKIGCCPYCGTTAVQYSDPVAYSNQAVEPIVCLECHRAYSSIYDLTAVTLDDGNTYPVTFPPEKETHAHSHRQQYRQ